MAGRDRSKEASLAASRTLNPHPEGVTDPAFTSGAFFDPADLVQVKYEMVRAVEAGGMGAGAAASAFGLARQSYYNARKALAEHGLAGLIPARPGPKGGHKLTGAVMDFLEQHAAADPAPSSAQLAAAVAGQFGVTVHKRSVERALAARRAARETPSSRKRPKAASTPPGGQAPGRTRGRRRSPAPTSSCAASPPAGSAAAGGTGQRCWPPRAWRRGWPAAAAWTPERPPAGQRDGAAAQPQAGRSPSADHPCPR